MAAGIKCGWVPDFGLDPLVRAHSEVFMRLPYVLVSFVDSDPRVGDMEWVQERVRRDPNWALSLDPLVTSGINFVRALESGLTLYGFDELWIPSRFPVPRPPVEANIMTPRDLSLSIPPEVLRWMQGSACRLGVGDGYGMNFVASDLELARELELPVL